MNIDLLKIIKELPRANYKGIGYAVGFGDIFDCLNLHHGINSQEMVNFYLNQLAKDGLVQLHRMDDNSDEHDVIVAVSVI